MSESAASESPGRSLYMHLVFGLACDGPTFPDFPGDAAGALDSAVVGPAGLIE